MGRTPIAYADMHGGMEFLWMREQDTIVSLMAVMTIYLWWPLWNVELESRVAFE